MKVLFDGPINNLSLGNVSVNFIRELLKKDAVSAIFPVGEKGDFESFDSLGELVRGQITSLSHGRFKFFDHKLPTIKCWHINGSEKKLTNNQYLYTFYEVDSPTVEEYNILKNQTWTFFSSSEAADSFKKIGLENCSYLPLGFDPDFYKKDVENVDGKTIQFGLIGKFEKRKNTERIIKLWLQRFGNNPDYQLNCLINNPFFQKEVYQNLISNVLEGKNWNNINFLPHLSKNSQVNDLMNFIDIDLSGLSNGEGWGLPAFNATALGKWSVVSNCSSHKDWATEKNSILVEPEGKQECYDEVFFKKGHPFNQGSYYKISDGAIIDGMERALKKVGENNIIGEKLREDFTYEKTVSGILQKIEES